MKRFEVLVTSREGIFDPAGEISKNALANLGFSGVSGVKIGKYIQLECDDAVTREEVARMCDTLLTNPVIEDYSLTELDGECCCDCHQDEKDA